MKGVVIEIVRIFVHGIGVVQKEIRSVNIRWVRLRVVQVHAMKTDGVTKGRESSDRSLDQPFNQYVTKFITPFSSQYVV